MTIPCIVHFSQCIVLEILWDDSSAHCSGHPDHGLLVRGELAEDFIRVLNQGKLCDWGEASVQQPFLNSVEFGSNGP